MQCKYPGGKEEYNNKHKNYGNKQTSWNGKYIRKDKAVEHKRRVDEKGLTLVLQELKQMLQTRGQ